MYFVSKVYIKLLLFTILFFRKKRPMKTLHCFRFNHNDYKNQKSELLVLLDDDGKYNYNCTSYC